LAAILEVKAELKLRNLAKYESVMTSLTLKLSCNNRRTILQCQENCHQWLPVLPLTVNGTELSALEFHDALLLRYGRYPPGLPSHCDGCLQKFSIHHALECKTGGLIISCHNEIKDELSDLTSEAISPVVCDKPKIHTSCTLESKLDDGIKENSVKASGCGVQTAWLTFVLWTLMLS
jgi:hypothetical protein